MSHPITLSIRGTPEAVAWVVVYIENESVQEKIERKGRRPTITDKTRQVPEHKSKPQIVEVTSGAFVTVYDIKMRVLRDGLDLFLAWPQSKNKDTDTIEYERRNLPINRPRRVVLHMDLVHFYEKGNHKRSYNVVAFATHAQAIQFKLELLQH